MTEKNLSLSTSLGAAGAIITNIGCLIIIGILCAPFALIVLVCVYSLLT